MKKVAAGALILLAVSAGYAAVKTETVEYKDGDTVLEGYLAYDDAIQGARPGVVVVHEWTGLGTYVKSRAEKLAQLGYAAFGVDIYGKGVRPANNKEAGEQATIYKKDRALMRRRALAGLNAFLKRDKLVDSSRVAAMGYCFGGTTSLEMARAGATLAGVVSFHGGLDSPAQDDIRNFKGKVLILHGADDPYVPKEDIAAIQTAMRAAGTDWQFVAYSSAVHSFTNPAAGTDASKGAAYNASADRRSWDHMKLFLSEVFEPAGKK